MGANKKHRNRLLKLYKWRKGRCYYCNRQTILPRRGIDELYNPIMATIEHLYSINDIRRLLMPTHMSCTVLSCSECNNKSNDEFLERVGLNQYNRETRWEPYIIGIVRILNKMEEENKVQCKHEDIYCNQCTICGEIVKTDEEMEDEMWIRDHMEKRKG